MRFPWRRRLFVVFALLLALAVLASACSSSAPSETANSSPTGTVPPTTDENGIPEPTPDVTVPNQSVITVPPSFNITIPRSPDATQPEDGVVGEPPTTDAPPTLPATTVVPDPVAPPPGPPPPPPPSGLPTMIMSTGDQLWSWTDGNPVVIVSEQRGLLQSWQIGDAIVAAQDGPLVVRFDGKTLGLDPDYGHYLAGVGRVGGAPTMAVVEIGEFEEIRSIFLIDMDNGAMTEAGVGSAANFIVKRVAFGPDRIVTSAFADLTEVIEYRTTEGIPLTDQRSPTEELGYNLPPLMIQGVLSPDGSRLAYIEGPDSDGERGVVVGSWAVVIYDVATGSEIERYPMLSADEKAHWLDYDGRFVIVDAGDEDNFFPNGPPVLIDTENATNQRQTDMSGYVTFAID